MSEKDLKKMLLQNIVELETLKTMLIQRGQINSMEYEKLKKKILQECQDSKPSLFVSL